MEILGQPGEGPVRTPPMIGRSSLQGQSFGRKGRFDRTTDPVGEDYAVRQEVSPALNEPEEQHG